MFDGPPPEMDRVQATLVYGKGPMFSEKSATPEDDSVFSNDLELVPVEKESFTKEPTVMKTLNVDFKVIFWISSQVYRRLARRMFFCPAEESLL